MPRRLAWVALAWLLHGCYLSHERPDSGAPRLPDARIVDDGGTRADAAMMIDAGLPRDAGARECPVLAYWPLPGLSRPLLAGGGGEPLITIAGDREPAPGFAIGQAPWTLDAPPAVDAVPSVLRLLGPPQQRSGRGVIVALGDLGVTDVRWLEISGGLISVRNTVGEADHQSLAFDGEVGWRWARGPVSGDSVVRTSAVGDERLEVTGDPAVLEVLDRTALSIDLLTSTGVLYAVGRAFHGEEDESSWVARLEVGDTARVTHAQRLPRMPNPYRSATQIATPSRLYIASSVEAEGVVSIEERDVDDLAVTREERLELPSNTGSCRLTALADDVMLFCSIGVSSQLFFYRPFSGTPGSAIRYVPGTLSSPHTANDFVWVRSDRVVVSSTSLEDRAGAVSLICLP